MKECQFGDARVVMTPQPSQRQTPGVYRDVTPVILEGDRHPLEIAEMYAEDVDGPFKGILQFVGDTTIMNFACGLVACGFTLAPRFVGILKGKDENAIAILGDDLDVAITGDCADFTAFVCRLTGLSSLPPRTRPAVKAAPPMRAAVGWHGFSVRGGRVGTCVSSSVRRSVRTVLTRAPLH